MDYVDGFLLAVPANRLEDYRRMAHEAGKIWMEHGALAFRECVGDDLNIKDMRQFPTVIDAKPNDLVMFSFIIFKSRAHRDEVNAKVMADPRIKELCDPANPPFECSQMAYGGFNTLVQF